MQAGRQATRSHAHHRSAPMSSGPVTFSVQIFFLCILQPVLQSSAMASASSPPVVATPLFRLVNYPRLQELFTEQFVDKLKFSQGEVRDLEASKFHWSTVTMFTEVESNTSWLIAAGFAPKAIRLGNSFPNDYSAVFGCQLKVLPEEPGGFDLSVCEILGLDIGNGALNHTDAGLLGRGLRSLSFPLVGGGGGVVVFCDPLWHKTQGTLSPGGRCDVLHRVNDTWSAPGSIEFCTSAGHTEPCAGGFSIDLRLSDDGKNVHLLASLPFAQPKRRVRIIDDLLVQPPQSIHDFGSDEEAFGSSVTWSAHSPGRSDALAVVGSPPALVHGYRWNKGMVEGDVSLTLWNASQPTYGGLGIATETGLINGELVVFIGAPYERVEKIGADTGRVLMRCRHEGDWRNFSLSGTRRGEMFGYAISRLGDVDGDSIADVAISAPSLGVAAPGRVYIHRVLRDCQLEDEPIQILGEMERLSGFGVSVSRSIDIDLDGGPEIAVTTLDSQKPVLIYSLPRRLRAKCTIRARPTVTLNTIKKDGIITLTLNLNLIDSASGMLYPIPVSYRARTFQINPDVLWLQQYQAHVNNQSQSRLDLLPIELFEILISAKLDLSQPRFTVESISEVSTPSSGVFAISAQIRAQTDGRFMGLDTVPFHVAFRSVLDDPQCSQFTKLCPKQDQPLIDWTECVWKMPPQLHFCPPLQKCSADLQISINGSGSSAIPVQYGRREDANKTLTFVLRNNGVTKSERIRVKLHSRSWPVRGLRVQVNKIQLKHATTGALLASSEGPAKDRWLVIILNDGASALIAAQQGTILYPDEEILIVVELFIAGLAVPLQDDRVEVDSPEIGLPNPELLANLSSAIEDPSLGNNLASVTFNIVYQPQLRISLGAAPPTLVDERKKAPNIDSATKIVLGNELGPQLEHVFLVENTGTTELHDIAFQLDVPIRTDSGATLLYLTDKARLLDENASGYGWTNTLPKMVLANGSEVGVCEIDEDFVNPLDLTIREGGSPKIFPPKARRRRSTPADGASIETPVEFTRPFGDNNVDVYFKRSCQQQATISCAAPRLDDGHRSEINFKVVCAKVICRLRRLSQIGTVRVILTGWLWTPTYFKHRLPDIKFVSRLSLVDWGRSPQMLSLYPSTVVAYPSPSPAYDLPQSVVFRGITGWHLDRIPLWPIVLGVVLGGIFLFGLVAGLYCLGFFRIRQRTNSAKRKSLMKVSAGSRPSTYARRDPPADFHCKHKTNGKGRRDTPTGWSSPPRQKQIDAAGSPQEASGQSLECPPQEGSRSCGSSKDAELVKLGSEKQALLSKDENHEDSSMLNSGMTNQM